jgi:3-methyladenine DNA glycosylase/8-oxoguanine DNA glycosylase
LAVSKKVMRSGSHDLALGSTRAKSIAIRSVVPSSSEHRLKLSIPEPFELDVVLRGHGWVGLAPHRYERTQGRLHSVIDLSTLGIARGPVVDVDLRAGSGRTAGLIVDLRARRKLERSELEQVRRALAITLALDVDLAEFWARCRAIDRLHWVPARGAGRLLRSAVLFEDLIKLLFTTNCTWANTVTMVRRTCEALGRRGPAGVPAFPSAAACARQPESFWRDEVRVGYRAAHCRTIAEGFASGRLSADQFDDPELPTAELRRRLLALPGFGPYAAGQALRLLGRFDDLAIDAWVRKQASELHGIAPGDDKALGRRYEEFGRFAGLALWMDVTKPWHAEE